MVPDFFPMPASVVFAQYIGVGQGAALAPGTVQMWRGNWEKDYAGISRKSEALHHDARQVQVPVRRSNCSDLWGSTGHQASHRGAAKHGIYFASRLVPKVCHFSRPGPELDATVSADLGRVAVRMAELLMNSAIPSEGSIRTSSPALRNPCCVNQTGYQ